MKKVLFAAACLLCLAACGTKEPNYQALAVGSPDIDITTDRAWYGLLGNVQTVRYKDSSLRFTEEGDLRRPVYVKVGMHGRTRKEMRLDMNALVNSTFDELGRISEIETNDKKKTITYTYEGNAYYPVKKETETVDSLGWKRLETVEYTYDKKDFDKHGNWLCRTENGDTVSRRISYHVDPYEIELDVRYRSAKDVAKAFYDAEVARDAEKALSTFEYQFRKQIHITVKDQQDIYQGQERDKTNVARYSIKGTEHQTIDNASFTDVKTKVTLDNGRSFTQTIRCYKAKDGNWYRNKYMLNE